MSNLFGNHIVGFPTRRLIWIITEAEIHGTFTHEPRCEKTGLQFSDQVRHKPACIVTAKKTLDISRRGIVLSVCKMLVFSCEISFSIILLF